MTDALIGKGVYLSRGDGASPEVYTKVAEIVAVQPPSMSRAAIEATHTDSADGAEEYIPGLREGGEVTITANLIPGNATQGNTSGGLLHDFNNASVARNYRITFPGSPVETCTFAGFVSGYQRVTPVKDRMTIEVTFKVTGLPVYA